MVEVKSGSHLPAGERKRVQPSGAGDKEDTVRGPALPCLPYLPLLAHWGPRGGYRPNELRPVAGISNYDFMEI